MASRILVEPDREDLCIHEEADWKSQSNLILKHGHSIVLNQGRSFGTKAYSALQLQHRTSPRGTHLVCPGERTPVSNIPRPCLGAQLSIHISSLGMYPDHPILEHWIDGLDHSISNATSAAPLSTSSSRIPSQ